MSICSLEDVAAATGKPFWFQLYVMRDREFVGNLIDRAKAAGCSALVLTLDLQILGQRHKDIKNGLSTPPKPTLRNLINLATKPRWCMGMLGTKRRTFGNIVGHAKGVSDLSSLSSWTAEQFDPRLSWDDVEWIKQRWGGKLILKGILDVEDAQLAANSGADALIVSNHGGRQLDGAMSSIAAVPSIADAVGSKIEVWMDGGVRSGQDILKAVALGARAAPSAAPSSTAWAPTARTACAACWRSFTRKWTPPWPCAAAARSCRATAASCCRAPIRSEAGRARLQSSHSRQYAPASRQTHSGVTMMSKKQGGPVRLGKALRLLAGAAMAVLLPAVAPAQQKTLYVGMNGGGMAEAYAKHVFPDFERAQGVRIEVVPGTSAEVLARAQAQKGKPGMHLMFLDDGVMVRAVAAGLCQPLRDDPSCAVPTAVRRDRKAVGLNVGMTGLGYNTRLFARQGWAPPTSWMDLADPGTRGKVVMQSAAASTFGLHAFLMFNRIQGGTDANTIPAFAPGPARSAPMCGNTCLTRPGWAS